MPEAATSAYATSRAGSHKTRLDQATMGVSTTAPNFRPNLPNSRALLDAWPITVWISAIAAVVSRTACPPRLSEGYRLADSAFDLGRAER